MNMKKGTSKMLIPFLSLKPPLWDPCEENGVRTVLRDLNVLVGDLHHLPVVVVEIIQRIVAGNV